LKQMALGCQMYAEDFGGDFSNDTYYPADGFTPYQPGVRTVEDDNVNFLYPRYVASVKTFVCPSTRNAVDPNLTILNLITGQKEVRDARVTAVNKDATNGISYEVLGEVRGTNKVSQRFCLNYALKYNNSLL